MRQRKVEKFCMTPNQMTSKIFGTVGISISLALLVACTSAANKTVAQIENRHPSSDESRSFEVAFHDAEGSNYEVGGLDLKKYSLDEPSDRARLRQIVSGVLAKKDERAPKDAINALEEALRLLNKIDRAGLVSAESTGDIQRTREVIEAYNSNFLSPVPRSLWVVTAPIKLLTMARHPIMDRRGRPATDLLPHDENADLSSVDPVDSSFWRAGRNVEAVNMYEGFGRRSIPSFAKCSYDGPKKSYGVHGGFKVSCEGVAAKLKLKFGNESKTEPFTSRLVWALGYNVTPIDYFPRGAKIVYDRRLITEYNSRRQLKTAFTAVPGVKVFTLNQQRALNPFEDAIEGVELKNGKFVKAAELRRKLIASLPQKKGKDLWAEVKSATFNEKFENQIAFFVLREGSLEIERDDITDLGGWSWNSLGHDDRRELRAFGLIAGWVNLFDARQNNNKLSLETLPSGQVRMIHEVSDLGSGFGQASDLLHYKNGLWNDYPWDFVQSRPEVIERPGQMTIHQTPFEFPHYSVIEQNDAFSQARLDDAQWIARRLARFSEGQLSDALKAAGFTPDERTLVLEKLVARRQQLIEVMGLSKEFPELMRRPVNRNMRLVNGKLVR